MKERLREFKTKVKAKAVSAFRPSVNRVPSAGLEPAAAEASGAGGGGSAQVSPAHAPTTPEPPAPISDSYTAATESSNAENLVARDPVPQGAAAQIPISQGQSVPESVIPQPWDVSIRKLWDVAYENLRQESPDLINKYESLIRKDMSAAFATMLPVGPLKRGQMQFVLQRKMNEVNGDAWKLKFGSWTEIEVKNIVKPVLGVINWANSYITQALSGSSQASIAWSGISLLLPLLLNPAEQSSSLAEALEYSSNLILQGRMREDLFIRLCESGTEAAGPQGISPRIYKDGLEKLYRQILTLQAEAYCYYAGNTSRIARDIVKWDEWEALLATVKEREYSFSQINDVWKDAKYDDECIAAKKRYHETRRDLQSIGADLTGLRQAINEARHDNKRSRLLTWLCSFGPSVSFNHNRNRHEQGTSGWLLNDCEEFARWQKLPASFLWLHGKAGSGKSVLSSSVITHLRSTFRDDPETALGYFYFSFTNIQSKDTALSSLIKQLCARRPTVPPSVDGFHEYMDRGDRPDTVMLEEALLDTTCGFSTVYIIIDALDECPAINDQRRQLLQSLCRLLSKLPGNVHVFCTSRKEPDILEYLKPLLFASHRNALDLTQGAHRRSLDRDIRLYIGSTLKDPAYKSWSQGLKDEVQDALIDKADGMFQCVFLQLQELRKPGVSSPSRIRQKLGDLPRGLDETYDRVLRNIDGSVRSDVRAMLMWVAFGDDRDNAFRVTLETLAQVLLFQPNRDGVVNDDEQLFQAEDILKFMPGLVITFVPQRARDEWKRERYSQHRILYSIDDLPSHSSTSDSERVSVISTELDTEPDQVQNREPCSRSSRGEREEQEIPPRYVYVRIAHFSVQEYLMSDRIRQGPAKSFAFRETEAHVCIAQTWLAYHFYSCYTGSDQPQRLRISLGGTNRDDCRQWVYHMEAVPREDWPQELENAAIRALDPGSKSSSCYFGRNFASARATNVIYHPWVLVKPHCRTAFEGWFKLTQLLLSGTSGANQYLTRLDLDAVLYCAAQQGHVDIVRLALEMGASLHSRHVTRCDPFSAGYDPWILQTALQTAANNGHITTVELLLAQGADTNARDSCSRSVLHTVVLQEEYGWRSTPEIITLLLDRCADVNALDNTGCSVLKAAMSSYCSRACVVSFESKAWMDTIRLLVERGADPRTCSNTLGELSGAGLEATQYLLDKGADVNQPDPSGETALHKAVNNREMDAFRLLIERGASVNAIADATSPSVLQAACYSRHGINYLPGLLNEGADPAAPPGCWGSAIHAICLDGLSRHEDDYLDMVRMVLDAGADVNAEGGQYGYPLQAAAAACWGLNRHHWHGREVVESLLNSGAHVNAQGGKYGSALQAACWVSDPHLVRLLLGRDADPNAAGGEFGNPLTAAVGESTDSYGGILSDKRSFTRVLDIVEMLLGAGAHVNARGNRRHGTALHAAAANASVDVVRLLLKRGANINGPKGGLYGSALQAACAKRRGDSSVPRLLLEHGADVLARGGQYGSAFHAAVVTRNVGMYHENRPPRPLLDTLDLLLASEPPLDVNDTGGTGGSTAIQGLMGTQWSQRRFGGKGQELEIIMLGIRQKLQLLVEHGVDVNLGGGKYGSPLQAACALHSKLSFGRAELLLELFPAIEVNNLGGFFGSPLQAAAYSGQTETVRMLLKRKADIHVRGGHYGSALNAAILGGKWDIVKILRVAGAKADCEISEVPDQLWLWQMEREEWEEYVYIFDSLHDYKQYGEDAVERYEKFWEVETGKEIPVDRVLEWLFG